MFKVTAEFDSIGEMLKFFRETEDKDVAVKAEVKPKEEVKKEVKQESKTEPKPKPTIKKEPEEPNKKAEPKEPTEENGKIMEKKPATLDYDTDIKPLIVSLSKEIGREGILKLFEDFGINSAKELERKQYTAFIEAAKKAKGA